MYVCITKTPTLDRCFSQESCIQKVRKGKRNFLTIEIHASTEADVFMKVYIQTSSYIRTNTRHFVLILRSVQYHNFGENISKIPWTIEISTFLNQDM